METGPRLKVSSDRLVKPGIEPATPGLQGKRFTRYTTTAPVNGVYVAEGLCKRELSLKRMSAVRQLCTLIFDCKKKPNK